MKVVGTTVYLKDCVLFSLVLETLIFLGFSEEISVVVDYFE